MRVLVLATVAALSLGCGEEERRAPATSAPTPAQGLVLEVDDDSYERSVEQADGPVLALFWAPWSGPDRIVMPYLEDVARERPGLTVVRIDTDSSPEAARRHEIMSIPTAMVLVDGRQRGTPVVGTAPQKEWERRLRLDEIAPRR